MNVLSVEIPFTPTLDMTANGRAGWRTKARLIAQAKACAHYATIEALRGSDGLDLDCALAAATEIKVMILIRWEPRRKIMDQDNALSGVKAHLDGIASAIGRDDKVFRILSIKQEKDPDGRGHVAVTLIPVGQRQETA